ncbi:hypothetical protein PENTCL1PPCAC_16055, partial [Pristionchus entomophagus]
ESFFSQYTNIIDSRSNLTDHEKLVYLRSALKGHALKVIDGIPIEGENLEMSISRLKAVYGRGKRANSIVINQMKSIHPKSHSLEHQQDCTMELINKVMPLKDKSIVDNFNLIHEIAGAIHHKFIKKMFQLQPETMLEALNHIETDLRDRIEMHSNNSLCVYCGKHSFSFCPNITSIQGKRTILKEKKLCFNNAAVTANEPVNGIARLHTTSVTLQNPLTNRLYPIEALVTDTIITRPMYLQPLSAEDYAVVQSHCGHVPHLAENSIITPDLLISIAEKSKLLACKTSMDLPSGYELVQSILGPMVIGRSHSNRLIPNHSILTSLITDTPFEKRIERFMSVDESARDYGTTETEARLQQNQKVEEHFHETSEIVDNQYEVQYFLKPEVSELPTNNELAF